MKATFILGAGLVAIACGGGTANVPVKANVSQNGAIHDKSRMETDKGNAKPTGAGSPAQSGAGSQATTSGSGSPAIVGPAQVTGDASPANQTTGNGSPVIEKPKDVVVAPDNKGTITVVDQDDHGTVTIVTAPTPSGCNHPIRSEGAYRICLDKCDRARDSGLASSGEDGPGAAGVRNAHWDCTKGCNGGKNDALEANCWDK